MKHKYSNSTSHISFFKILGFAMLVLLFIIFNIIYSKTNEVNEKENKIETFTDGFSSGHLSYSDCVSKGYSKEFCLQTPTSVVGPAGCICPNGSIGTRMPGFRGRCVCNNDFEFE
jgi:hypothetical protein